MLRKGLNPVGTCSAGVGGRLLKSSIFTTRRTSPLAALNESHAGDFWNQSAEKPRADITGNIQSWKQNLASTDFGYSRSSYCVRPLEIFIKQSWLHGQVTQSMLAYKYNINYMPRIFSVWSQPSHPGVLDTKTPAQGDVGKAHGKPWGLSHPWPFVYTLVVMVMPWRWRNLWGKMGKTNHVCLGNPKLVGSGNVYLAISGILSTQTSFCYGGLASTMSTSWSLTA